MFYYVKLFAKFGLVLVILLMTLLSIIEFLASEQTKEQVSRRLWMASVFLTGICISIIVL